MVAETERCNPRNNRRKQLTAKLNGGTMQPSMQNETQEVRTNDSEGPA